MQRLTLEQLQLAQHQQWNDDLDTAKRNPRRVVWPCQTYPTRSWHTRRVPRSPPPVHPRQPASLNRDWDR